MKFAYFSIPIYIFILIASPAHAANVGDVVINEIAWMGTVNSHNDEWLELYNTTNTDISIEGWVLRSTTDDSPEIFLIGSIPAKSFFLLERTDDTSVPDQQADQIYTGSLKNSGERLEIVDAQGNPIDNVNSLGEWFAGENIEPAERKTMERKNPRLPADYTNWATSIDVDGTPKAQNSVYQLEQESPPPPSQPPAPLPPSEPTPPAQPSTPSPPQPEQTIYEEPTSQEDSSSSQSEPTEPAESLPEAAIQAGPPQSESLGGESTATSSVKVSASPPPSYPTNIFINEVMPYPLGPDSLEEWVELINENEKSSDISGWKIKDTLGSINTYTFPEGTTISPTSFLVFSRPTTKITMNNDRDAIQLIRPDGELIQTVAYQKAPKGKSYVRVKGVWDWSAVPTPGSANILPLPRRKAGTIKDVKKIIEKTMANDHNNNTTITSDNGSDSSSPSSSPSSSSPLTASIGQVSPKNSSSYMTALLASLIAFLSAVFVFILKKRLSKS